MGYWLFPMNSKRATLTELTAFTTIVRHGSFRAAADELAMSPSTLSHMMRGLEERLAVRLFNRTTRSVAPTQAGTRLFRSLMPVLSELDAALADVDTFSSRPSGNLRINASESATQMMMQEIVPTFVERYPDVHLDLVTEGKLVDIVADGFDAGVRLAEAVPQDMIAVPFGTEGQFLVVASPAYLETFGVPRTPDDLHNHRRVRFRLPSGKMYRWEFERHEHSLKIDVPGPVTIDHMGLMVRAAIQGVGIAYVSADIAREALAKGELVAVLTDWTPPFAGQCLYYPSHRLVPPGLRAFVDIIKEVQRRSRHA